ncbi:NADH dehydrogenase ubiquinone Fe-S protein 4 [uncultured Sphingomonas sp.]|uniref:NADH dehydrogenase ubiquinone Fe-S protein 4 n=1 Tax=uncultured Sphingomonas sp. TaxID=158754 RepID=UPI0030FB56C4
MQTARIYQRPKNAMQSGKARTDTWQLEFEPGEPKRPDPLTGWAGSGDTRDQIRLAFPTCAAAVAYAEAEGLAYTVIPAPEKKLKLQSYADNFR